MWDAQTPGERLYAVLRRSLESNGAQGWTSLESSLRFSGRGEQLREFFLDLATLQVARRLIEHARPVLSCHSSDSPLFSCGVRDAVADVVTLFDLRLRQQVEVLVGESAVAAASKISDTLRRRAKREAAADRAHCYLCGTRMTYDLDIHSDFTLDHIWPRAYGGSSELENLLPACRECNTKKKRDFATWSLPSIQSVNLGVSPKEDSLTTLEGSIRFAIHHRAIVRTAVELGLSLREAYRRLGPWTEVEAVEEDAAADFFNLRMAGT